MEYIATFDFTLYADTSELARFASGFLFKEMLEHFSQKANSTLQPDRSFWMYSGHDFSIANALNSIGVFEEVNSNQSNDSSSFKCPFSLNNVKNSLSSE